MIYFAINGAAPGSIYTTGTGVVHSTASDERLKENIRPTAKGLKEVMRIQVSDFNFKSKPGSNETGFIAQQLYTGQLRPKRRCVIAGFGQHALWQCA
ncbi:MAG TPA: tail fiber domain-containing protein [Candidatus Angelobacter sp.]